MSDRSVKIDRRALRKALGPEVADLLIDQTVRLRAHAQILHRGFWGRLAWLILGR